MDALKVDKHIDVLDGVRALAVGFVAWFHFWQQSWITPRILLPEKAVHFTRFFGITHIDFEGFVRYGFQFVDMLILLSAFCNFYPYARAILLKESWPDTKSFYIKRAVRILPSYYLALIIMMAIAFAEGNCKADTFFIKDLVTHVLCVAPLFPDTYLSTGFNGVLWTVQVEVLYYIMLPWIAKLFRRWPLASCMLWWGCGIVSSNYIIYEKADMIRVYGNHILTFAGCYANGMLLGMLYITLKGRSAENRYTKYAATLAVFCCILYIGRMMGRLGVEELQVEQLRQRFELSLVFSCFILALPFSCECLKRFFAHSILRFLAVISYNFYIWHQYVAVKCKEYRFPFWEGEVPPNMTGDLTWMWKYQMIVVIISMVVAVIMTYGVEKPLSKALTTLVSKKGR